MATEEVQPLKIVKSNSTASSIGSPTKMARPLSEIGSTERRRNSPSYNQTTKKMVANKDSSPFDSSPLQQQRSPRMFWEDRASPSRFGSENSPERPERSERSASPSGTSSHRRSSIENLKKASRVKNSTMYARETKQNYDPSSSPVIERPLSNRGWGGNFQNNVFTRFDSLRKENNPLRSPTDADLSPSKIPGPSSATSTENTSAPASPRRETPSPTKSSLTSNSRFTGYFETEQSDWPEDEDDGRVATPRAQPRHAKSVTFETAPPEINEYEQQTPEPSSIASGSREGSYDSDDYDDNSFERASSIDEDSFDASLEDTDKTPVVLPEDWRHMSPEVARNHVVNDYDDVFDDDDDDETTERHASISPTEQRPSSSRSESANSDAEARPLPPLPGVPSFRRDRVDSGGLAAAAERASSIQRSLPSPPRPASVSKDEILRMRETNMSMEDRMNLLALQTSLADVEKSQNAGQSLEEGLESAHENIAGQPEHSDVEEDDLAGFDFAPSISRESILRNVKSQKYNQFDAGLQEESMVSFADRDYRDLANLDPDVPIPSRETSTQFDAEIGAVIKEEDENSYLDLSAVPSFQTGPEQARLDDYDRQGSVIHHADYDEDSHAEDDLSRYSSPMSVLVNEQPDDHQHATSQHDHESLPEEEAFATPLGNPQGSEESSMGLPLSFLGTDDFDFGLKDYMTPTPPVSTSAQDQSKKSVLEPPIVLQPSFTTEAEYGRDNSFESDHTIGRESFGSVIHGSMIDMSPPPEEAPIIPERKATIKTQGKLKARPSGTPADLEAMKAQRRHVSYEVPAIPDQYRSEFLAQADEEATSDEDDFGHETHSSDSRSGQETAGQEIQQDSLNGKQEAEVALREPAGLEQGALPEEGDSSGVSIEQHENTQQSREMKLDLDFPLNSFDDDMGLGMDAEFDRVIESQKKGYLMRQNTKVIVASNRNFSDESQRPLSPNAQINPSATSKGSRSPRKSSAGEKFLTTEPWNGKTRRKSSRRSSGRKSNITGPAPPVPGHESSLGVVDEYMTTDETGDGEERGRLFVKVVGVKELDLPLPRNDRLFFQLTLDNGLHCVTTADLQLGRAAAIGQEFELVVLHDLEFQLTLTTKLPAPAPKPQMSIPVPVSPTKPIKSSTTRFSRLLSSPKKRAERERKEREEAAEIERRQQEEMQRKRASVKPTSWDMLREVVDAKSGSFARAYVSLKSHESQCFGRQLTVDVPCFNEWAMEKDADVVSSIRSKRNNGNPGFGGRDGTIRRPPYAVGKLELQLMYIPKPKGSGDEHMPKSMSSAVREMKAAEQVKESSWEGCLSQQGGDCPYWRRRFFRLQGTKLTAYHEHTRQPRATINLSKATRMIDDQKSLVADPTSGHPTKGRRKSAFAEEDDGYQFVEEGFRMRFANGETIDFYADSAADKDAWMKALGSSIGKPSSGSTAKWTDMVLNKERSDAKAAKAQQNSENPSRSGSDAQDTKAGAPKLKRTLSHQETMRDETPPTSPRPGLHDRHQVKSMIY
ncbi:DUF1709-domain-containing protein [Aureobasidium subglaciale]|nr:DUF1709-domain-containing protein [Aureobasidium subglaciale]